MPATGDSAYLASRVGREVLGEYRVSVASGGELSKELAVLFDSVTRHAKLLTYEGNEMLSTSRASRLRSSRAVPQRPHVSSDRQGDLPQSRRYATDRSIKQTFAEAVSTNLCFMSKPLMSPVATEALQVLAASVKTARLRRRWSINELAERVGVSHPTIMKVERADPTVAVGTVLEAAAVLGVPLFDPDPGVRARRLDRLTAELALLPRAGRHSNVAPDDDY